MTTLVTHGRHCPCSACARQDWTDPILAHCGMHGPSCPAVYAPLVDRPVADRAPLSAEDAKNLREVVESQARLGHPMTIVPNDVLLRLLATLDAARAHPDEAGLREAIRQALVDEAKGSAFIDLGARGDGDPPIWQEQADRIAAALRAVPVAGAEAGPGKSRWSGMPDDRADALLDELSESPLPGARYARDVVRRRLPSILRAAQPEDDGLDALLDFIIDEFEEVVGQPFDRPSVKARWSAHVATLPLATTQPD